MHVLRFKRSARFARSRSHSHSHSYSRASASSVSRERRTPEVRASDSPGFDERQIRHHGQMVARKLVVR